MAATSSRFRGEACHLEVLEAHIADSRARLFFLVRKQQSPAGATAVRILAVSDWLFQIRAKSRQQVARLIHFSAISAEVAGIMVRHGVRWVSDPTCVSGGWQHHISGEFLDKDRGMDDLDRVAEFTVIAPDRFDAVRAGGDDLFWTGGFQVRDIGGRELLVHVFVAGPLRRIAGAFLLRQDAEPDLFRPQDFEHRLQRLLEVGLERTRAAEPDQHVVFRRVEGFER